MKREIDTREEVKTAIKYLATCFAIFVYATVYALAAWGWFLLNWESNFLYVLIGWAMLFYFFGFLVFPLINGFGKPKEK